MPKLVREIRDPIHGFIRCNSVEADIINTRVFQRLRRVKQLALASLVYPGALHTRFEDSLGVMHLAGRLYCQVLSWRDDPEELRTVRLAALLHDIGHGPFSHVSESVLELHYDREKVKPTKTEKIHELLTQALIEHSDELRNVIGKRSLEQVVGLLSGKLGDKVLRDIISGPLDADKLDYLLRDSYYCGVKYGIYDVDRLISTCQSLRDKNDIIIAVSGDGIHSLEQFILAKYYMTTQVYRHKVRLITDSMIIRGLSLGISVDKIDFLERLYRFDGSEEHLKEWLKWDDESLTYEICRLDERTYARRIFTRLRERKLFKRVYHENLNSFAPLVRARLSGDEFNSYRDTLEAEVGEVLGVDRHFVIAHRYAIQSVREQSGRAEGSIPVVLREGEAPVHFDEASTLFHSIDEAQKDEYLDFYALVVYQDEADKRKREREYRDSIHRIINKVLNVDRGGEVSSSES